MTCCVSRPELRRHSAAAVHDFDDSFRPSPLSPLNISPLLLPVSIAKSSPPRSGDKRVTSSWKTPHTVEVVRRPGESLGISIVGGLLHRWFLSRDPVHSADYSVTRQRCLSSGRSHAGILSKRLNASSNFSRLGSHTILVFPYQAVWQYSDGDPPN